MLGYPAAVKFLRTDSEEDRSLLQVLAAAARKIQEQQDVDRANMIANAVGKMFGG